jgi:hypothetical protein
VQKELSLLLKTDVAAQIGCILLPALLLPLVHLSWVEEPKLFLFWLGSSLIYGTLYQITRHVEAALLCRLLTLSLLLWLSQSCTAFHL